MIILGINAYHADSSAAIFVNGKMIAAIEEQPPPPPEGGTYYRDDRNERCRFKIGNF